jgi:1A family penicillin-binding protein
MAEKKPITTRKKKKTSQKRSPKSASKITRKRSSKSGYKSKHSSNRKKNRVQAKKNSSAQLNKERLQQVEQKFTKSLKSSAIFRGISQKINKFQKNDNLFSKPSNLIEKYFNLIKRQKITEKIKKQLRKIEKKGKTIKVKNKTGEIFNKKNFTITWPAVWAVLVDNSQFVASLNSFFKKLGRIKPAVKIPSSKSKKGRGRPRKSIPKKIKDSLKQRKIRFRKQLKKSWKQTKQEFTFIKTPPKYRGRPKKKVSKQEQTKQTLRGWLKAITQPSPDLVTYIFQFIFGSLLISALILAASYSLFVYVFEDLPQASDLISTPQRVTTRITDRHGELLFRIYEDENRTLVPLSSLPEHTIQASIAIEDQDFYSHHGFSLRGILRALSANIQGKPVQGGSTITQQLVKNRLLSPERTIRRKIREVILAVLVDGSFTKEQILEMYFNQVAYGGATYGIEEAAQTYFGKPASQLSLAESAMLAGLPAAPSVYNPFGSRPEFAYTRQREVLRRMIEEGFISSDQGQAAATEILEFRSNTIDIKAPHFVMYVRELLADQYTEDLLSQGGLEVTTTLDLELQNRSQEIVTTEIDRLARLRVGNGAALITNPKTGEVLAMVGSRDYFDFEKDGQVNVTMRPRQPGSSIKPLTYATAMSKGRTPYSIINDQPIVYQTAGSKPYAPKNYDGKFHGRVTLKQALASSYNIPAVKLLAEIGINNYIDQAEKMGISTWAERTRFGLSLTLGGGEVLMTDMAEVYGTFANLGYTVPLNPILEIKDASGKVLYRNACVLDNLKCGGKKTLDARIAYQISDMLSDNKARTPAFGSRSVLHIPDQQVSVKTGTTNSLRDNWTIGYTEEAVVAVWVGNNDNRPMSYIASGITGASPIWNDLMRLLLDDENPHTFSKPGGLVTVKICERTGTLTCTGCPRVIEAEFVPGTEPTKACNPAIFRPKPSPSPGEEGGENRDQILDGVSI